MLKDYIKKLLPLSICLILIGLILLLKKQNLLFGGEGNYFLDFNSVKDLYRSAWFPLGGGVGSPNPLLHQTVVLFDILGFLQRIGIPYRHINTLLISSYYVFPFLSMYFLIKYVLKKGYTTALLVSLFYIVNPFFVTHVNFMMMWNIAPLYVLPLAFSLLYIFYKNNFSLFFFFGAFTALFSYSFENIPYLGIFHIFLPISLVIISLLHNSTLNRKVFFDIVIKYVISLSSFILFNLWWLLPLLRFQFQDIGQNLSVEEASTFAKYSSAGAGLTLTKILTFTSLIGREKGYFFSDFYHHSLVHMVLFIPILVILLHSLYVKKKVELASIATVFSLVIIFFLTKGYNEPFRDTYAFFIEHIPFFLIFKTPLEKFALLTTFLTALSLVFALNSKKARSALMIYIVVCSIPYITLNFIPDFTTRNQKVVSRVFLERGEDEKVIRYINSLPQSARIFSLPGSTNYQVTLKNGENSYYRGMDPILFATNKPFMATYFGERFHPIYRSIAKKNFPKLLGLYAIHTIHLNNDIYPAFGFIEKQTPQEVDQIFSSKMEKTKIANSTFYTNPFYLERIYAPESLLIASDSSKSVISVIDRYESRLKPSFAIVQKQDNKGKEISFPVDSLLIIKKPTINFTQKTPSQYSVSVRNIQDPFFLVFSESYHRFWELTDGDTKVAENSHLKSNGFSNIWYIEPTPGRTSMNFDLEFTPERLVTTGVYISGSLYLLAGLYGLYTIRNHFKYANS